MTAQLRARGVVKSSMLALALWLVIAPAYADKLIAVQNPWPPYLSPDLEGQGLSGQIVREALRRQGHELEIRFLPWARALRMVKNGGADLLVAAWWTQERSEYLRFSEPYVQNNLKFIKRKNDDFEFEGLQSLSGKRLGLVRSYGYGDQLTNAKNYHKVENLDLLANIRMLLAGRIDLTLEDELVARYIMSEDNPALLKTVAFTKSALSSKPLYVASGLSHPKNIEYVAAFNRGLKSMREDGTLDRYLQQLSAPQ